MRNSGHSVLSERVAAKSASRLGDEALVQSGLQSAHEVNRANSFFYSLGVSKFQLAVIGNKRVKPVG